MDGEELERSFESSPLCGCAQPTPPAEAKLERGTLESKMKTTARATRPPKFIGTADLFSRDCKKPKGCGLSNIGHFRYPQQNDFQIGIAENL